MIETNINYDLLFNAKKIDLFEENYTDFLNANTELLNDERKQLSKRKYIEFLKSYNLKFKTLKPNIIYRVNTEDMLKKIANNSIDCIITDPPYIVDTKAGGNVDYIGGGNRLSKLRCDSKKYWEEKNLKLKTKYNLEEMKNGFDIDFYLGEFERVLKKVNMFIFCSNKQISSLMKWGEDREYITTLLYWTKTNPTPFANGVWRSDTEFIIHIREKGATFQGNAELKKKSYTSPTVRAKWGHPTEKPLDLVKKYIQIGSNKGDIILDPFMGSGTTAHACIDLNRKYLGFEIEKEYYKQAKRRLRQAKGNVGLFNLK